MYIAFLIIFLLALIVNFIAGRLGKEKLMGVGLALGFISGIILVVAVNRTPSNSSTNPYFLGTFLLIMCTGVPMGIGYNLGEFIRKKKQ